MVRRQQLADRALRPAMRSPGRPIPARHVEREFWRLIARGDSTEDAAIDDHSRLAYAEIHDDEQAVTAVAFWQRAKAFFEVHGIEIRRVLTDNGSRYRSRAFNTELTAAGIAHKYCRPTPNGSVRRPKGCLSWACSRIL